MNRKKIITPNIIDGGIAIPLGNNYYYMKGRKHKDGGIDIGPNNKNGLEVEDGEIMKTSPKEVKVYSSVPFLNGRSPVEKILGGDNPNTVFRQQEEFKDKNKINDDGTKKKAKIGIKTNNTKYITKLNNEEEKEFQNWYSKVYKYKKLNPDPDAIGQDYDYRGYWKNENRENILNNDPNAHFVDKYKQPNHPTFSTESKYSDNINTAGTWNNNIFVPIIRQMSDMNKIHDYLIDTGEGYFNGIKDIFPKSKKNMGGLSRSKNYGSKSKPYPNVDKKDFAGGNRSYPIPTKADAVDALRLAGLHGRNDVKAKVYAKYPELKNNKKRIGGISMLSSLYGGVDTDDTNKSAKCGTIVKLQYGGKELLRYSPYKRKKALYGINDEDEENKIYDQGDLEEVIVSEKLNRPTIQSVPYNLNYNIPNITINKKDIPQFISKTKTKSNFWNKLGEFSLNNLDTLSSAASNIISGGIGYKINKNSLNNMTYNIPEYKISDYYQSPVYERAVNLKTKHNINPQLREIDEAQRKFEMDVDSSTSSSQTAIARKQAQRLNNVLNKNKLYSDKENKETELINADRLNRQNVEQRNIQTANEYLKNKTAFDADQLNRQQEYITKQLLNKQSFENTIREKQSENKIGLINNINSSIQNIINNARLDKKNKLDKSTMLAAYPNIPIEYLRSLGIVTDKEVENYRKVYPIKQ